MASSQSANRAADTQPIVRELDTSSTFIMDVEHDRFPFCIVWTPIPVITWLLPFVGHMGICDSIGVCHDFAGPYFISRDNLAFGRPCKYLCLYPDQLRVLDKLMGVEGGPSVTAPIVRDGKVVARPSQDISGNSVAATSNAKFTAADMWDAGVYRAADQYRKQMYNFFCNNCHSYAATALEQGEQIARANNKIASVGGSNTDGQPLNSGGPSALENRGVTSNRSASSSPNPNVSLDSKVNCPSSARLSTWNMVTLATRVFFCGSYVSFGRFLQAHLPFLIIVALVVGFTFLGKSV